MTSDDCLDPIRPINGEVSDDMQSEVVMEAAAEMNKNDESAEVEETRKPKAAARPYTPTRQEIYEHEVTHLPYRPWCRHCVYGRGVATPHPKPDGKEKIGITVSMDYCFMQGEEDEDPNLPGVLIMWDDNHECLWALPVDKKGPVDWIVRWIVDKLDEIGYRGQAITLKSDQERSIVALKTAVAAGRVGTSTLIESPVRESQCNGAVEQAVRRWQGQLRTLKGHFEENMNNKLPIAHPLMNWLVIWAGEVLLKYKVRESGRTAYENITGHRVKHPVVMFGETMNFKLKQNEPRRRKMETEWSTGIFVGVDSRTSEALVVSGDGLFKCRTVRRVIREEAFNQKWLEEAVTPIDEYVLKGAKTSFEDTRVHKHVVEGHAPVPADQGREYVPRRARLNQTDFEDHGYTQGCRGCEFLQTGLGGRQGHSDLCRSRIEVKLLETEIGQARLGRTRDRIDHWTSKEVKTNEIDKSEDKKVNIENGEKEIIIENSEKKNEDSEMEVNRNEPEEFDIGSPEGAAADPQEESIELETRRARSSDMRVATPKESIELESRGARPSDRRLATPERTPARKRRAHVDKDSPPKRLVIDAEETMDSDDGLGNNQVDHTGEEMQFDDPGDGDDGMIGFFKGLNIVDITEVFSPPRVVKQGEKLGFKAGTSMDLMTGWNFELKADRERAIKLIKEEKPKLLIGSPPCTYFSMLQELNKFNQRFNEDWLARFNDNLIKAKNHIRFCIVLYKMQMDEGRYWLHEHPWSARSWDMPEMEELLKDPRVQVAHADQCQYGLTAKVQAGSDERGPAKKPTGFIGNAWAIISRLRRRCDGGHVHVKLEGGRAKNAALYPDELCREMCLGLDDQLKYDAKNLKCLGELNIVEMENLIGEMLVTAEEYMEDATATESVEGSPPSTDEGRRVEPELQDEHTQGGSTEPKLVRQVSWADMLEEEEEVNELRKKIEHDMFIKTKRSLMEIRQSSGRGHGHKQWPAHWKDAVHDEDGGYDMFGRRTQDGRATLRRELMKLAYADTGDWAQDDVSGVALDPELVKKAREVEMTFFRKMVVYTRVPRAMQKMKGGKIIGVRWVDVNKGDAENPDYRSRLVGQEYNTGKDDELYASTPPLEALRFVVSSAATTTPSGVQRHLMVNDVRRAYFYAKTHRDIYVELPPEDTEAVGDQIGKLNLSLYGTRDAASNWQEHLSAQLEGIGFTRGAGHPSVFHHKERGLVTLVHGDDYTTAGEMSELKWFQKKLEGAYEIKTQLVGPEGGTTGKILNRVITWTGHGYELEADPRHSELIVEQMGVTGSGGITTAGAQNEEVETPEQEEKLDKGDVTLFRGVSARGMYLGPDRPEMLYAGKEVCREMSDPSVAGLTKLTRIAKFLAGRPRVVWEFPNQEPQEAIDVYVDANWAGCRRTRKSTSGGCAMLGRHCLKAWSKTQAIIAKSSGESELYGVIKGSSEGLGLATLAGDFGVEIKIRVHVDATAAKGMVERRGLSRVRHIEVDHLWIQEQEARRMLPIGKVWGGENPADLMTKNVGIELAIKHMTAMGIRFAEGRTEAAANLHVVTHEEDKWNREGGQETPTGVVGVRDRNMNIVKKHVTPRRELFAPSGEDSYPRHSSQLESTRITYGTTASGKEFEIEDNWRRPGRANRKLDEVWTGKTVFRIKASALNKHECTIKNGVN